MDLQADYRFVFHDHSGVLKIRDMTSISGTTRGYNEAGSVFQRVLGPGVLANQGDEAAWSQHSDVVAFGSPGHLGQLLFLECSDGYHQPPPDRYLVQKYMR